MKTIKLITVSVICFIAIFIIHSCSKSKTTGQTSVNANMVNISGMAFPASTTIKIGDTTIWINKDGYPHTVTSDDGTSFNSGNITSQATFSFKATISGTFAYHCNIHANMHGTLVVAQ